MKKIKEWMVGFRKFTYGILFFSVSLVLMLTGYVTGEEWIKYNSTVVTAFFATNVGEHIINIGKEWIKNKIAQTNMDILKGKK